MREIKFRVRDASTKKIIAFEQFNTSFNNGFLWTDARIPSDERVCNSEFSSPPMVEPDHPLSRLLREEYTGLKDCNGVEIYEGDIVQWGHVDGYIERSGVRVAFVDMSDPVKGLVFNASKPIAHKFKIGNFMYAGVTDKALEVIGNIHENPELLAKALGESK